MSCHPYTIGNKCCSFLSNIISMQKFQKDQSIQHVFVLMLENHSFDHLLGFSGITGLDAETGKPTKINGLKGGEVNSYDAQPYPVTNPADNSMPVDPGHEFMDTLMELTGTSGPYIPGAYPPINNSGFVENYVTSTSPYEGKAPDNYGEIMKCFAPEQLPILTTLAKEFAVCDNWFSSMPGPTWPNRFFVHTASSGGLDHSPTTEEIAAWEFTSGIDFENGTVFEKLGDYKDGWRIYRGNKFLNDSFPSVAALKGVHCWDARSIEKFEDDLKGDYPYLYTFIEPSYGNILNNTYEGGTSQHPLDNIHGGEALIKQTYEAIRNSPLWEKSLLVIVWDEHGGFYDHVAPPKAVAPGDKIINPKSINQYGFDFTQYGVRVPAVIVSPYIAKNTIDHRLYDHSSVPATLGKLFDFSPLTERDKNANNLIPLISDILRTDTPSVLPAVAMPNIFKVMLEKIEGFEGSDELANKGSLPGFLHAALNSDLQTSPSEERPAILANFKTIKTQRDARRYMKHVQNKIDNIPD